MTMTGISAGIALGARSFLAVMRRLAGVVFDVLKKQNTSTLAAGGIATLFATLLLGVTLFGSSEPGAAPAVLKIDADSPVQMAAPGSGTSLIASNGSVISDPALIEISTDGPLPRISRDGRKAMDVYARAFDANDPRPKIALIVSGLGLSASMTQAAVDHLPPGITFAFTPYGASLQGAVSTARANGHEVLIEVPLEPYDYPNSDPGQNTLLTGTASVDNPGRLQWVMSRFTGYAGLINAQGSKFLASEPDVRAMMQVAVKRGLYFVDSGQSDQSLAREAAGVVGAAFVRGDLQVDRMPSMSAIEAELARLEVLAQQRGTALGVASVYPVTLNRVIVWANGLEQKGITLVPVSALAATKRSIAAPRPVPPPRRPVAPATPHSPAPEPGPHP